MKNAERIRAMTDEEQRSMRMNRTCMYCEHHYPVSDSIDSIHMICINAESEKLLQETDFLDDCEHWEEEDIED